MMIADNQTVRIRKDAAVVPYWRNKTGKLLRWVMGDFYIVEIEDGELKELVFHENDFEVIE